MIDPVTSPRPPETPGHDEWSDLKAKSFRGGFFVLAAQALQFCIQITSVTVLARLLTPVDYGLFGIVMAIIVALNLVKDMGLPLVTIQRTSITRAQLSNLFWINSGLGIILSLVLVAASPAIASFYREPRLISMFAAMSVYCIAGGVSAQPIAIMRRSMRFKAVALIEIISFASGVTVAIITALYGSAYWSLVCMYLTIGIVGTCIYLPACKWLPSLPRFGSGTYPLLRSGWHLMITSFLSYATRNVDTLLIGWWRGPKELGFYEKAYNLMLLPTMHISLPISGVALPALSKMQVNEEVHRRHYGTIVLFTASLGMALVAFLFVEADRIINLVLGPQWAASVPLFRALAPAAFVDTSLATMNWALISLGRERRLYRLTFVMTLCTVAGFTIGLPWGATGVAVAFSVCRVGFFLPILVYVCRHSQLIARDVLRTLIRPVTASAGAAVLLAVIAGALPFKGPLICRLIFDGLLFCCCFLGLWVLPPGGRRMLKLVVQLLRNRRPADDP